MNVKPIHHNLHTLVGYWTQPSRVSPLFHPWRSWLWDFHQNIKGLWNHWANESPGWYLGLTSMSFMKQNHQRLWVVTCDLIANQSVKEGRLWSVKWATTYRINLHLIHTPIWIMRRWPEVEKVEVRQKGKWPSWMGHSLTLWTAMVELAPSLTFTFLSESSLRVGQLWMLVRPLFGLVSFQVFRSSPCTRTCFVLLMMMDLGPKFLEFFS